MLKSPFKTSHKTATSSDFDMLLGISDKMNKLDEAIASAHETRKTLEQDNQRREQEHQKIKREHQDHVATLVEAVKVVNHVHENMMVGPKGEDAPVVDEKALEERIKSTIRQPKDGETPVIDEEKIAQKASKLVKVPEVKVPQINHQEIVDKIFEMLDSGKKKFSIKHIGDFTEGLEQTIRPIRSLAAGFRGGGDVVTGGTNIVITTDVNGKKVISSTAGGGTFVYNEVVAGSNTTFTLANTPLSGTIVVYGSGQRLVLTTDYTIVGAVITPVNSWNAGDIIADYQK